ncbi:hypothetical protein L596_012014 [Steinernema carpocapsae]|uniref:CLIP1 zinc knuckle domain-containing protein n=1 Tax=Steinernema carpocapsae TaxID=34508 RepID=A0A4U5NW06_STECR|nr:hypothetical protein L596_012014 [Steinernema carpocapsae]
MKTGSGGNEEELNQLRDEIDRHKQEQERLNAVLEERSKEQSTLQKEKEDILKQCQANEHALAELQAKLNEQEAVQTQLKEANEAEARKFEEEFQAKLKEREEAFQIVLKKRTEAEAGKSEAESADLRAQIEDLRAAAAQQSESSSGELQRLQEELRKQQEEQIRLSALLADVKDAPDEVATLRSEKENLQETVDQLKTALSSREEAIQAERQRCQANEDVLAELQAKLNEQEAVQTQLKEREEAFQIELKKRTEAEAGKSEAESAELRAQIEDLRAAGAQQSESSSGELQRLQEELRKQQEEQIRLSALLADVKDAPDEVATLRSEKENLQETVDRLKTALSSREEAIQAERQRCQANEDVLAELQAKLNEQEAVQTQLKEREEAFQIELKKRTEAEAGKSEAESAELRAQIEDLRAAGAQQSESSSGELQRLQEELRKQQEEQIRLSALLADVKDAPDEVATLRSEKENLQETVDRLKTALSSREEAIQAERQRCQANEDVLAELQAKLNEQEAVQTQLKEREEAFQIELKKRTEAEAEKSEAESAELRAQIEDLRAAAAQLSESSSGELQRLQEELRKQQEEQIRLSALLADVKDAPDEVATLRSEKENLQETVDRLKTALSSREEAIQAERQRCQANEDVLAELQAKLNEQEAVQTQLKEREEAFQIELKKRTEAEAEKSEAESAELRAQIEDLRAAAAQLSESSSGELQRLQEELRKQQEEQIRLSALLADVKDAPDEVATLRSEKENLQETVDRLKTALSSREEAIQAERQQSKMLQDFIKNMNEDMKKREVHVAAAEIEGSQEDLAAQVAALMKEKLELKADLSQKIDLFLETDNMRERKEKENLLKIEELEKELIDAKVKKSDNELIQDLERQVEFSHSIIATQQRRIDKLTEEIKQMNIALGQEGIAIEFEKKSKRKSAEQKKEIRKYCDICEEFDQHDTEDCPSQTLGEGDFEHKSHSSLDNAVEEKPASKRAWIRKFCDHCDEFDLHETEDCPNPQ